MGFNSGFKGLMNLGFSNFVQILLFAIRNNYTLPYSTSWPSTVLHTFSQNGKLTGIL